MTQKWLNISEFLRGMSEFYLERANFQGRLTFQVFRRGYFFRGAVQLMQVDIVTKHFLTILVLLELLQFVHFQEIRKFTIVILGIS